MSQKITNKIAVCDTTYDTTPYIPTPSKELPQSQQHYLDKATAANTRRAYQAAIRQFEAAGGLLPATEQDIVLNASR